jgi:Protein of unknown function (DUF1592)/Protein of unknown function (DUF1588)/Protein of unknown function (DUF1587)/Protein of unknown function (DUF1595)/Ca-dependent carbohydrate-binding module xylan-binding/Protein of unknown function (DUF1585)
MAFSTASIRKRQLSSWCLWLLVTSACQGLISGSSTALTTGPVAAAGGGTVEPMSTDPLDPVDPAIPCIPTDDPGRVTIHRLNRFEYDSTVRDLLDDSTSPASQFPLDDFGYGFDNISDVLSTSPILVEKYESAAEKLAETVAIRDSEQSTSVGGSARVEAETAMTSTGQRAGSFWNIFSNGNLSGTINTDAKGTASVRVRAYQSAAGNEAAHMVVSVDGVTWGEFDVLATETAPAEYVAQGMTQPGPRQVKVSFTNDYNANGQDRNLYVDWFELAGPGAGQVSKARVFSCDPSSGDACVQKILSEFARKAWRRPATAAELARLKAVVKVATTEGDSVKFGVILAVKAILLSPDFMYRVETDEDPQSLTPHPLSDFELASRLSYFLWGTTPDDELNALADSATLSLSLRAQVQRMLGDPKAAALTQQFAGRWLGIAEVEGIAPNSDIYPGVDGPLKKSMANQTNALFAEVLRGDVSALEMMSSDHTFLDNRLAKHLDLPSPGSESMTRVLQAPTERRTILGQPGVLSITSFAQRTSPVRRGRWVLDSMLCSSPDAPPPNIPQLNTDKPTGTLRQIQEQHSKDPRCKGCHVEMDAIGYGLEAFDGVGRVRTTDSGGFTLNTASSINQQAFSGATELSTILKKDHRFPNCITKKLLTYALGRGEHGACVVSSLAKSFQSTNYKFPQLIEALVQSPSFTQRRGELP